MVVARFWRPKSLRAMPKPPLCARVSTVLQVVGAGEAHAPLPRPTHEHAPEPCRARALTPAWPAMGAGRRGALVERRLGPAAQTTAGPVRPGVGRAPAAGSRTGAAPLPRGTRRARPCGPH